MVGLLCFVFTILASPFKSKILLEAENTALRHQLIVLRRQVRGRVRLTNNDHLLFVQLYRWFPSILKVLTIIRPETLIGWHRVGFRRYWRWKSRSRGGRPQIEADLRALIRRMNIENSLWRAPRIHGELLKLGIEVAQWTVAKYMVNRRGPPSQRWRTFLRNHAPEIAARDWSLRLAGCVKACNSLPLDRNFEISMPRINSTDTAPVPTLGSHPKFMDLGKQPLCRSIAGVRPRRPDAPKLESRRSG
jgi:hypothetical protein